MSETESAVQAASASRYFIRWIPLALILGAVAWYGGFLYQFAMNIPLGDDIRDVLQVAIDLEKSDSLTAKLAVLFEQHNDHRTLSSRLVYWAIHALQGELDFRVLTFVANAGLLLLLLLLYVHIPPGVHRLLGLLPAALVLVQIRAYGLTLWPMAAFAYFYVYVYAFASLLCLRTVTTTGFALALLFATLATFTLASGQVVWVVGLAVLGHQARWSERGTWSYAVVWSLIAAAVLWIWRIGLDTPNTPGALLVKLLEDPLHFLHYYLALLGAAVGDQSVVLATIAGALMMSALLWSSWRSRRGELDLEMLCWFVALSTAAVVLGRAPYTEVEYALSARYSFPSVIMLASTLVMVCARFLQNRTALLAAVVLLTAAYWSYSWSVYPAALQPYVDKRVERFNKGIYWIWSWPISETNAIVAEAVERGIYVPPDKPYPRPVLTD